MIFLENKVSDFAYYNILRLQTFCNRQYSFRVNPFDNFDQYFSLLWFLGTQFGTVVALLLSGLLADEFGWEWVFYFFGILGCIWCVAWTFICHDSPAKHPRISEVSRVRIQFYGCFKSQILIIRTFSSNKGPFKKYVLKGAWGSSINDVTHELFDSLYDSLLQFL